MFWNNVYQIHDVIAFEKGEMIMGLGVWVPSESNLPVKFSFFYTLTVIC